MSITGTKFTKELTLDIYSADLQVITAQQGDKLSRYVKINILANGEPMEFISGLSASLQGHRADGQVVDDKCTIEGNSITIELTDAMLAVAGDGEYKIIFYGTNGSALSTVPFKIHVTKNPFDESAVIATPIFSSLTDALNKINKALTDAEKVIEDSTEKIEEMNELKDDLSDMMNDLTQAEKDRDKKVNDALDNIDDAIKNANDAANRANETADKVDEIGEMYENYNDYFVLKDEVGVSNGVASLDENGKVPKEQLPDGIDEELEKAWFIGTQQELEQALVNGEIDEETKVFVTDDGESNGIVGNGSSSENINLSNYYTTLETHRLFVTKDEFSTIFSEVMENNIASEEDIKNLFK